MKNNEGRGSRKRKKEKLHISISNHKIGFLKFLKVLSFSILMTFKNFVIRP